ncbi:MAG: amino acid adenylation domain-containing protein [Gammaproteobacteria bacterium]|nr:amino acid adenylation domain-containing protein [Gammaproteobacteria bacterium]
MTIIQLISDLAEQDIRLWLEQGNLRYSAPEGAMTAEVIAHLREHKTELVNFLQQSEQQQIKDLPKADRQSPSEQGFLASPAQQRLWFLQQLEPDNSAYHIHAALSLQGPLDIASLNKACSEIIQRHEILRTHYELLEGTVRQFIAQPYRINLDAQSCSAEQLPEQIHQHLHERFDLSDSVFRCQLWQTAHEQFALAFTVHHIAADGWSLGIFVNELISLYQAYQQQQTPHLAAINYQYIDYAHWQHSAEQQEKQQQQLQYWQETLKGCPHLDLPIDKQRTQSLDNTAGSVNFVLNPDQLAALNTLSQQQGATLFMTLLSIYALLLQRYSQQDDFAIGTPIAGRSHSSLEPMIGCFLNVLAIRCELDDNDSFIETLAHISAQSKQAFEHQDLPFERIVNDLVSHRDLSQSPIFQTLLSLQNAPLAAHTEVNGLRIDAIEETQVKAQFDLKLTVVERDAALHCQFEFKQALFHTATIENMAAHFIRLTDLLLANPEQKVSHLDVFGQTDMASRLLLKPGESNATHENFVDGPLIHRLFEQQVAKTPEAIAVSDDEHSLSYAALNQRANVLAQHLINQGQQANAIIGVCLYRSVDMITALLAVLKSGCAYLPMDPDFPPSRLAFIAKDAKLSHIITEENCLTVLEDIDTELCQRIVLEPALFANKAMVENPDIMLGDDALFNVIYTSGSTGQPKGVMVPHSGICNRLQWMQSRYALDANDVVLQKTPYSFDVSVWELFWPLISGSHYYFAKPEGHKDPTYLRDVIQQHNITTLHFVPSMLGVFLQTAGIEACSSLRHVFCSGEALQLSQQQQFFKRLAHSQLINLYGPTEASIDVSYFDCMPDAEYASIPIGKAISNTQLHVLDKQQRPLPVGIAGELYIGGQGLAQGYLNREDLTQQSFIDNPFAALGHPSARLYKSGDLVRLKADGNIDYLGRIDHQVKVRGNRIELGEIEHCLCDFNGVREAIVTATQQGSDGNNLLLAYYVADESIDAAALTAHLSRKLPAYMQPAAIMAVEAWPLSLSGKINRNKLPEPDWNALNEQAYVAPSTDTEKTLAEIWAQVLNLPQVGIHDNFFHIGGHSLLATQALALAQEQFKVEIPLREIFENPSIQPIAALLDQALLEQSVFSDNSASDDDEDMETFVL